MSSEVPRRSEDVVYRRLAGGEAVVLHLGSGAYHELNRTGALLWELLDGHRDIAAIAAEFASQVDDAPGDIDGHVRVFVDDLRARDLAS